MEEKYCLNYSSMDKDFFDEYIKHHIITKDCKKLNKKINDILEAEGIIECYSIGLKSERVASYSELWFLDINLESGLYLPVFIQDINTSSYYALSRCNNQDFDNDDDTDYDNFKSIDEILELCPKSTREQVSKILKM